MRNIKRFFLLPTLVATICVVTNVSSKRSNVDSADYDLIRLADGTKQATSADYCLLTFDPNQTDGGSWNGISGTPTFQVRKGHNWNRIKNKKGIPTSDKLKNSSASKEYKCWVDNDNKNISDYYTFNADAVTFKAKWGEKYIPSTFDSDSWDIFIQAADKGYEELKTKYKTTYEYNGYNTFIIQNLADSNEVKAKTRYVTIEGYTNPLEADGRWPVRVIGENHDHIYEGHDKVATLTFEFAYALYPSISYDYTTSRGHQSWDKSSLKEYLNTYLYYQFEDALKNGIQYVEKNTDNGYGTGEVEATKDILFIPSASEMSNDLDESRFTRYENSTYGFYQTHTKASELIKRNPFKKDSKGNPTPISTWLRSPNLERGQNECKAYMTRIPDGEETLDFELKDTNYSGGICPCFAVGEDSRVAYNFNGNGLSLTPVDRFADTTKGFSAKISVEEDSKYDIPTKIDKITFDGVEIEDSKYKYDNSTGELDISTSAITSNTGKLEIYATPHDDLFKSDSWSNLISYANQGLSKLQEIYGEYDSFVGKYKYLTVNGKSYKCRVIGQEEDSLAGDEVGNKALLTFQFETVLDEDPLAFSSTDATYFPTSSLNKYLQNQASLYLPSGIKKVKKTVDLKETGQGFGATTYETKLFPLSFSEMNINASHPTESEGKAYSYYESVSEYSPRKLKYLDNKAHVEVPHWLRSPANVKNADYIDVEGELKQDIACTDNTTNYIAPAFCIGIAKKDHTLYIHGQNYTYNGYEISSKITYDFTSGEGLNLKEDLGGLLGAAENYTFTEDCVKVKTSDNKEFTDFVVKEDSSQANQYNISIEKTPDSDLEIVVSPEGCFKISIEKGESTETSVDVGFSKGGISEVNLQYCTDGENFYDYKFGDYITLKYTNEDCVYFRAKDTNEQLSTESNSLKLITREATAEETPKLDLSGNIMSLFDKSLGTKEFKKPYGIKEMFRDCPYIYDASALILGGATYSSDIEEGTESLFYADLFNGCTRLAYAPFDINFEFKNNQQGVFQGMFNGCKDLIVSPTIKVNMLCSNIFNSTFYGCTSLKYASDILISDGEDSNSEYAYAFTYQGCTSLIEGPSYIGKDNIDTAEGCCHLTFDACSNLEKGSPLNFNKSTEESSGGKTHITNMYSQCSSLRSATINIKDFSVWTASHLVGNFNGCKSLTSLYLTNLDNNEWTDHCFESWLSDARDEEGCYIYLRNNLSKALQKAINSYGYGESTILYNWGIRNIDTGEELRK